MISKKELFTLYIGLLDDVEELELKVASLEKEINKMKGGDNAAKRGPGRPRKNEQPRDKSGKFMKKK